ncbi:MAG: polyketide synthase [Planctomycetota bacterium]
MSTSASITSSTASQSDQLHPSLRSLLSDLRGRIRRYVVWEAVLLLTAFILVSFWFGFAVDYLPVRLGGSEMPRSARAVLLGVMVLVVVWRLRFFWQRVRRTLPDDSLALLIERKHPDFAGRLVTSVQLKETGRVGDWHSPLLLESVHREAVETAGRVDLGRIFQMQPLRTKAGVAVPMLVASGVFAIASPSVFRQAIARLSLASDVPWPRKAQLEAIGLEVPVVTADERESGKTRLLPFREGVVSLPRGGDAVLRVRAAGEDLGYVVPDLCTLSYHDEAGNRGRANFRRVGRLLDGYQGFLLDGPPLTAISSSLNLQVQGLDDRIDSIRVNVTDPPAISELDLEIRYPEYLRADSELAFDLRVPYQAGIRVREGSDLTLHGFCPVMLDSVDVFLMDDGVMASNRSEDATHQLGQPKVIVEKDGKGFRTLLQDLRRPTTVSVVPKDKDGITSLSPYRYYLGVIRDQAPELSMRLRGIGTAITPNARIPALIEATDDYGIASLQWILAATPGDVEEGAREKEAQPDGSELDETNGQQVITRNPDPNAAGAIEVAVDLRAELDEGRITEFTPGTQVQVYALANDCYDLGPSHEVRSDLVRLDVVTPDQLLALLERRELEFRSRLEQAIDETERLKQSLGTLREPEMETSRGGEAADQSTQRERPLQRLRLRVQQAALQASKSTDELAGVVNGLEDLLAEMTNNRLDTADRRERLDEGVRLPLRDVVQEPFPRLRQMLDALQSDAGNMALDDAEVTLVEWAKGVDASVVLTDQIVLQLNQVLDRMLDLESFNEILDLVRGLIDDQAELTEETREEQKKRLMELFQ